MPTMIVEVVFSTDFTVGGYINPALDLIVDYSMRRCSDRGLELRPQSAAGGSVLFGDVGRGSRIRCGKPVWQL